MGEIILVVIGILIALQINTWNENRKTEHLKQTYYNQLLSDLETDKVYADTIINSLSASASKYENYLKSFNATNLTLQDAFQKIAMIGADPVRNIQFKTSTISTLINTGEINIFSIEMRDRLSKYNATKKQCEAVSTTNNNQASDIVAQAVMQGFNPSLWARMQNQPKLKEALAPSISYAELFLKTEGYFLQKQFR